MDKRVRAQFSARAHIYDENRRKLIADFDEFYHIAADVIAFSGAAPQVLDLGAGTGLTTDFLLRRFPEAQVTLVDFSEEMLAQARARFHDRANVHYLVGDYRSLPATGAYDVIVSGLSIHHLEHSEKQALFSRLYELLKPGGEFVNADLALGTDERLERLMQERLVAFLREGLSDTELQRFFESQGIDDPAPVLDQLLWLVQTGFGTVDCVYRRWIYAVFYARK
ncbi:MAG: class I SAM-dependent methyltransferase [Coriobacteriales bacterium]|jgi:tRNA (cmo5U34)-methyltransferase|nr:class I SAM-dependent methyltransferase [Coriobacteriales bacterium]